MSAIRVKDEQHWHELRSKHIGGSEVSALFGQHRQITRFELWHRKAGNIPEPDFSGNERLAWGLFLEPAVAKGIAEQTGWKLRKVHRYYSHDTVPGSGASLDYEIQGAEGGPGALEIKTVDRLEFLKWDDGEPPLSYQLQAQQQLSVTGWKWGAFGVLIGGNELRLFPFERHDGSIARIEAEIGAFWKSIEIGQEPQPDYALDATTIAQLYAEAEGGTTEDMTRHNRLSELIEDYERAAARKLASEKYADMVRAEIFDVIKHRETVICGDKKISAKTVPAAEIAYERAPYRAFRVSTIRKPKKEQT